MPPGYESVECAYAAVGLGAGGEKPAGTTAEVRRWCAGSGASTRGTAGMNAAVDTLRVVVVQERGHGPVERRARRKQGLSSGVGGHPDLLAASAFSAA